MPFAVPSDGSGSARVEVVLGSAKGITAARLSLSTGVSGSPFEKKQLGPLLVDGAAVTGSGFDLYDDGTHGNRALLHSEAQVVDVLVDLGAPLGGVAAVGDIGGVDVDEVNVG